MEKMYLIDDIPFDIGYLPKRTIEKSYISIDPEIIIIKANDYYYLVEEGKAEALTVIEYFILLENLVDEGTIVIKKDKYDLYLSGYIPSEIVIYKDNLKGIKTIKLDFVDEEGFSNFSIPSWFKSDITGISDKDLCCYSRDDIKKLTLTTM